MSDENKTGAIFGGDSFAAVKTAVVNAAEAVESLVVDVKAKLADSPLEDAKQLLKEVRSLVAQASSVISVAEASVAILTKTIHDSGLDVTMPGGVVIHLSIGKTQ